MTRSITPEQREREEAIVILAMNKGEWVRPGDLALRSGLKPAVVLAALRALQRTSRATRREYLSPRTHIGKDRVRKTSRLIVEYRLLPSSLAAFPAFLLPPAPNFADAKPRLVRGRASLQN